jgi:hypothetical protein
MLMLSSISNYLSRWAAGAMPARITAGAGEGPGARLGSSERPETSFIGGQFSEPAQIRLALGLGGPAKPFNEQIQL